ncbi:Hypp9091 [Branchiostoma lanceolatum]|uniref:Hypp9091 protein n=1 Tax=Branchiostoma lanceolatum TaxID=7740 RepID=A0A8K0EFW0_BRALA|nr:Hypp9091 [Branchiostoma lanceolatum]
MILALALVCLLPICSCSAETWGAPVNFDSMCRRETLCFLDCPFGRASDARGCEICACRMPDMSMFGMETAGVWCAFSVLSKQRRAPLNLEDFVSTGSHSQAGSHIPDFVPNLVPFSNGLPFLAPQPELQAAPLLQPVPQLLPAGDAPQLIPASPQLIPAGDAPQLVPALEPVPELQPALQPAPQLVPARRSIPSRFLKTGRFSLASTRPRGMAGKIVEIGLIELIVCQGVGYGERVQYAIHQSGKLKQGLNNWNRADDHPTATPMRAAKTPAIGHAC